MCSCSLLKFYSSSAAQVCNKSAGSCPTSVFHLRQKMCQIAGNFLMMRGEKNNEEPLRLLVVVCLIYRESSCCYICTWSILNLSDLALISS